jgi:hypothetical protein
LFTFKSADDRNAAFRDLEMRGESGDHRFVRPAQVFDFFS